jgi:glycosyltransferase involved in cell wall biosynthesis
MIADIIIPTLRRESDPILIKQVDDITKTRILGGEIIATCQPVSSPINRNRGLKQSTSDIIIMLDDDITGFYEGWDNDLVSPINEDPNIVMVSARLMNKSGGFAFTMTKSYDTNNKYDVAINKELPSAAIAFRKSELRFDENFIGSSFEDNDFCRQMQKKYPQGIFLTNNLCRLVHLNEMKNQQGDFWKKNKKYFLSKYPDQKDVCHN